jgi:hypothetical protein
MRRVLLLSLLVLAAVAPAASAGPAFKLGTTTASFLAVDRSLWVQVDWSPSAKATDVTVVVAQGSHTLKTLRATHWLVGKKTFTLAVPRSVPNGATLTVQVGARSSSGSDSRTVSVPLK